MVRQTYTYVECGVSLEAYGEIRALLLAAGYEHAIGQDGAIDMHGLALVLDPEKEANGRITIDIPPNPDGPLRFFDGQPPQPLSAIPMAGDQPLPLHAVDEPSELDIEQQLESKPPGWCCEKGKALGRPICPACEPFATNDPDTVLAAHLAEHLPTRSDWEHQHNIERHVEAGKKCVLWGRPATAMTERQLLAFIGFLDTDAVAVYRARISELEAEVAADDKMLEQRDRLLEAIPACDAHGDKCIPAAIAWVEAVKLTIAGDAFGPAFGPTAVPPSAPAGDASDATSGQTTAAWDHQGAGRRG